MALTATLNGAYDAVVGAPSPATSGTTVTATTAALWPDPATVGPYGISIWPTGAAYTNANGERALVTGKSGAVLTIVRAREGSTARTVVVGDQMALGWGALDGRGALDVGDRNLLVNPGFAICQPINPAGATLATGGAHGPDGWYVLTQTGNMSYSRSTPPNSPAKGPYLGIMTNTAGSAQRMMMLQVIPFHRTAGLRGEQVRFEIMLSADNTMNGRIAILEWTGTADSVTKTIVNTWTSTSYTSGNFFTSTTKNVLAVSAGLALDTTPRLLSITAPVGASANNLIVCFWTEGTCTNNGVIVGQDSWFVPETVSVPYISRSLSADLDHCQHFYYKSYNRDTAPAASSNVGIWSSNTPNTEASSSILFGKSFATRMRITPTITLYDFAGNSGKISELSANVSVVTSNVAPSVGATHIGETGCAVSHDPAGNIGGIMYHLTADARL